MTRERAAEIADARIASAVAAGYVGVVNRDAVVDSIYHDGEAPDLVVWGAT
jgi:hypothetical protein